MGNFKTPTVATTIQFLFPELLKKGSLDKESQQILIELAENSLVKSKYLESLLNTSTTFLVVRMDLEGRYTYANRAYCDFYGLDTGDVLGHTMYSNIHPDELGDFNRAVLECTAMPGKAWTITLRKSHKVTGEELTTEWELVCITSLTGSVVELQAIGQDITLKLAQQRQLADYKEQQEIIMGSIKEVIWSLQVQGTAMQYISPACVDMLGFTPEEFYADSTLITSRIHPEDVSNWDSALKTIMEIGAGNYEYRWYHSDGSLRHILGSAVLVHDKQGKPWMLNGIASDITRRRQAEEEIRNLAQDLSKKNSYLESILNTETNFMLTRADVDSRFTYVNDAYCRHFGYSRESLLGKPGRETVVEEDRHLAKLAIDQCIACPGKPVKASYRKANAITSEVYDTEWEFIAIADESGVIEVQGIGQDVTEKNQVQQELSDSKALLERTLASVSQVIWSINAVDNTFLYISPSCLEVFGYSPGEVYANPALLPGRVVKDDKVKAMEYYSQLLQKESGALEYRIKHKDGSIRYIVGNSAVTKDELGNPVTINGILSDVTSIRNSERNAKESERRLTEIMESITDNFFVMDEEFRFTFINRPFRNLMAMTPKAMIGKSIWELFSLEKYGHLTDNYVLAMTQNQSVRFELFNSEMKTWFQVYCYPIKGGLAVYLTDITERKNAEQMILDQNIALREIAWVQSHKVRAPLARLMGLIQIVNVKDFTDPNNEVLLKYLINEAKQLDEIITEVVRKTHELSNPEKLLAGKAAKPSISGATEIHS